jgi:hypothetical protein
MGKFHVVMQSGGAVINLLKFLTTLLSALSHGRSICMCHRHPLMIPRAAFVLSLTTIYLKQILCMVLHPVLEFQMRLRLFPQQMKVSHLTVCMAQAPSKFAHNDCGDLAAKASGNVTTTKCIITYLEDCEDSAKIVVVGVLQYQKHNFTTVIVGDHDATISLLTISPNCDC